MREDRWLGERLGAPAWTVEADDAVEEITAGGFVQAKVPAEDVARIGALEGAGFRVVDVNVTLRREPGPLQACNEVAVHDATGEDRDAVLEIAAHDYSVSRFHLDPQIPDERASEIKRAWVDNFFRGERGDRLLVAEADGAVAGFLLALATPSEQVIDLIAVASAQRSRGAGAALIARLIDGAPELPVLVGTQVSNVGALRFYERLGFKTARAAFVLHRHS